MKIMCNYGNNNNIYKIEAAENPGYNTRWTDELVLDASGAWSPTFFIQLILDEKFEKAASDDQTLGSAADLCFSTGVHAGWGKNSISFPKLLRALPNPYNL
jgi:hypothetical protein